MTDVTTAFKLMKNVTFDMTDAAYWIRQNAANSEIRMNLSQIKHWNQNNLEHLSKKQIMYCLDRLPNAKAYGVCVRRGLLWDNPDAKQPLTAVYVNEPVVILEEIKDWYQICCVYYKGWIQKECVGVCESQNQWKTCSNTEHFLIVTADYISLPHVPELPDISELRLDMGVKLELACPKNGRSTYYNYMVKIPVRQRDGGLKYVITGIPMCKDVCIGYLEYTGANVLGQAFKTLGNAYGWGGSRYARDCSALVMDIHRCFGILLPRDVSGQMQVIGSIPADQNTAPAPGDILGFPGHTMIYVGYRRYHYVISAVGSFYLLDKKNVLRQVRADRCVVSELDLRRSDGLTWNESLRYCIQLYKT